MHIDLMAIQILKGKGCKITTKIFRTFAPPSKDGAVVDAWNDPVIKNF